MSLKVGINGFGRIGRNFFRATFHDPDIDVVAVNDITDSKTLAHLLKYDSVLGILEADIQSSENAIIVNGKKHKYSQRETRAIFPGKSLEFLSSLKPRAYSEKDRMRSNISNREEQKKLLSLPLLPSLTSWLSWESTMICTIRKNTISFPTPLVPPTAWPL